ncbi:hypothetical protein MJK72_06495 [Klebsiella pneumoniae]|nr:hypothetical protein MJK72_06495 [Klebsiella pneumoniae]
MFSLDNVLDDLWPQARPAPWQKKLLKKLFHEEEFATICRSSSPPEGSLIRSNRCWNTSISAAPSRRTISNKIPEYGPLVIIANHPTGTLDGLALLYAVSRVRRDLKVVTNRMLTHLEPLKLAVYPGR